MFKLFLLPDLISKLNLFYFNIYTFKLNLFLYPYYANFIQNISKFQKKIMKSLKFENL